MKKVEDKKKDSLHNYKNRAKRKKNEKIYRYQSKSFTNSPNEYILPFQFKHLYRFRRYIKLDIIRKRTQ